MLARPATLLVLPTATTTENVTAVSAVFVRVPEKDQTPAASAAHTTSLRASLATAVGFAGTDSVPVSRVASTLGPGSGGTVAGGSETVASAPDAVAEADDPGAAVDPGADGPDAGAPGASAGGDVHPERAMTPTAAHRPSGARLRIVPPFPAVDSTFGNQGFLTGKKVQSEIISDLP
ncbi:hypothetical protein [Arthrobacter antioxidans]|uniref:hypothetical protein n=1 Tax=Arthrobacter antioxidans TaxID=2895818 RepID=UPI001FFE37EB|nr:hypothetical protein [Arthrobacter antioxidans]